jgi:hypothetical protein
VRGSWNSDELKDWPQEKIRSAALLYTRKHSLTASESRFTCLDARSG